MKGFTKVEEDLPIILSRNWRTETPLIVITKDQELEVAYFERIEDRENGERYFGGNFAPKFVCEDSRSKNFRQVLEVTHWKYLY